MNDYFSSVGRDLAQNLPQEALPNAFSNFLRRNFPRLENFNHTNPIEVKNIILKLKNSSPGHDNVNALIVKKSL